MSPFPSSNGMFSSILPHVRDCVKLPIFGEGLAASSAAVAVGDKIATASPRMEKEVNAN